MPNLAEVPHTGAARLAPHNIDAERQLLGAILVNNEAWYRVADFLQERHFFLVPHQGIYEKISQLIRGGHIASPVTLKTCFKPDEEIAGKTPDQYLVRLTLDATTIINVDDYGRIIHDLALRRGLIGIGETITGTAYDSPVSLTALDQIEAGEKSLYELAEAGSVKSEAMNFGQALTQTLEMAAAAYNRQGKLSGIATGLKSLDQRMGGMQPSDLIIVASRPGMGKTSLATNIAFSVASAHKSETSESGERVTIDGGVVGFFSLEMSAEQLTTRIISERTEIASSRIRRGTISNADYDTLTEKVRELQDIPLYIDETGGLSIAQLAVRARRLKRRRGLDLLVVDYVQLLTTTQRQQGNRVQEITEITARLKSLAKELNVPILALSQLSRQVETREDKRPQLSDLRESGSIEQDADVVLFVYREEYYLQGRSPPENTEEFFKWQKDMERVTNRAEILIAKQRHGPTGSVDLVFQAEFTRFSDYADNAYYPPPPGE